MADHWARDLAAFGVAIAALAVPHPVLAHVQDYQILRLLSSKTVCNPERVDPKAAAPNALAYHATCANETFYPDGIDILCADRDDDRSCRVLTEEKSFRQLDLLRRPP